MGTTGFGLFLLLPKSLLGCPVFLTQRLFRRNDQECDFFGGTRFEDEVLCFGLGGVNRSFWLCFGLSPFLRWLLFERAFLGK